MKKGWIQWISVAALSAVPFVAAAQKAKAPHVGYVHPAGGQRGATVTVRLGGENIYGATTALVSGAGATVEVVDSRDPNEGQLDPKKKNKKKNEAAIDEIVTLRITLAADAEPGDRDLCLATTNWISNKLVFQIGEMPEVQEVEPNNKRKAATPVASLPVVVNGQILPGDVDWFQFKGVKGQRLVVKVASRELLPYIADGVPGWFQAMVTLVDAGSNVVAVADSYRFNQDPLLIGELPGDGEYAVAIRDTLYRGREDFGYRMSIGDLPIITDVYPLGGPKDAGPVRVKLAGVNLAGDSLSVEADAGAGPFRTLVVTNKGLLSNRVRFGQGRFPEVMEDGPATDARGARTVRLPVVINACLRAPGDKHYYSFDGRGGHAVSLEVEARRLGSPVDSVLELLDGEGRAIAANDDLRNAAEGFMTHHADSGLTFVPPGDGRYTVMIRDAQGRGGRDYAYRLSMGPPVPDFELRVTPAAVRLQQGGSAPVMAHVIRRGGFTNEIRLVLGNAPAGLSLDGGTIPPGVDRMPLTFSAAKGLDGVYVPAVKGVSTVDGREIIREAVPAENQMQAFLYQHLMPFREYTVLAVPQEAPFSVKPVLPEDGVLTLTRGKETNLVVTAIRCEGYPGAIRLQLEDPPKGMSFRDARIPVKKDSAAVTLRVESGVATNLCGNLVFSGAMQVEREATPEEKARIEAKAAREREAKAAALGTNTAAGVAATNMPAPAASREGAPVMVNRPVEVTFAAIPFRVVEPPPPAKAKQEKAGAPKPAQAAVQPEAKGTNAEPVKATGIRSKDAGN